MTCVVSTGTKATQKEEVPTPFENFCQPQAADGVGEGKEPKDNDSEDNDSEDDNSEDDSEDDDSEEEPEFAYLARGKQVIKAAGPKNGSGTIRPVRNKRAEEEKEKEENGKK